MKNSRKAYRFVLAAAMLAMLALAGCDENNCYYECEEGFMGALGAEDEAECNESAADQCADEDEGELYRAEYIGECEEGDAEEDDPCAPAWWEPTED